MSSSFRTVLTKIESHLLATGYLDSVNTVEPKGPPGNGMHAAVWFDGITPVGAASGLSNASAVYTYQIRLYRNMLAEPADDIDWDLLEVAEKVFDVFAADLDLGDNIRNIDFFGAHSSGLRLQSGYLDVSGVMYRIYVITLPLVVNDAIAAFA